MVGGAAWMVGGAPASPHWLRRLAGQAPPLSSHVLQPPSTGCIRGLCLGFHAYLVRRRGCLLITGGAPTSVAAGLGWRIRHPALDWSTLFTRDQGASRFHAQQLPLVTDKPRRARAPQVPPSLADVTNAGAGAPLPHTWLSGRPRAGGGCPSEF